MNLKSSKDNYRLLLTDKGEIKFEFDQQLAFQSKFKLAIDNVSMKLMWTRKHYFHDQKQHTWHQRQNYLDISNDQKSKL